MKLFNKLLKTCLVFLLFLVIYACNDAQSELPAAVACDINPQEIRITEVYSSKPAMKQQWIELFNFSDSELQLNRTILEVNRKNIPITSDIVIPAGSFMIIGNQDLEFTNLQLKTFLLNRFNGNIKLKCKDITIDEIDYSLANSLPSAFSLEQNHDENNSDDEESQRWCQKKQATPGKDNGDCSEEEICLTETSNNFLPDDFEVHAVLVNPKNISFRNQWITLKNDRKKSINISKLIVEQYDLDDNLLNQWTSLTKNCQMNNDRFIHFRIGNGPQINDQDFKVLNLTDALLTNLPSKLRVKLNNQILATANIDAAYEGIRLSQCESQKAGLLCENHLTYRSEITETEKSLNITQFVTDCDPLELKPAQAKILARTTLISDELQDESGNDYRTMVLNIPTPGKLNDSRMETLLKLKKVINTDADGDLSKNDQCIFVYPGESIKVFL